MKKPTLVVYWTDTRALLTYSERQSLEMEGMVISLTPSEILIADPVSGRKAAIRGTTDPHAPSIPPPVALA